MGSEMCIRDRLLTSSGDTAECETIVPSDSDDIVDHELCGLTCSKVNVVDDKSSESNSTSG